MDQVLNAIGLVSRLAANGQAGFVKVFALMERKSAGLRLLVIDDDVLVRWSIAESLKESGDFVVEAADASAAVDALANAVTPIDAILLDYRLAESDGLTLLATIRQMAPRIPVVMMTAFGSPELSLKALQMGACEVVAKPFDMSDLASMVRRACGERSR